MHIRVVSYFEECFEWNNGIFEAFLKLPNCATSTTSFEAGCDVLPNCVKCIRKVPNCVTNSLMSGHEMALVYNQCFRLNSGFLPDLMLKIWIVLT
jgi:hypothetical protein